MSKKINNEEFIEKSRIIHDEKYIYDKCKYVGNRTKVIITCPKHGDFIQLPYNHLDGKGCQICGGSKKHTKESFIEKSKVKHNNKYNYDFVEYLDSKTKVKILCSIHGIFEQLPENHIKGSGCHKCGGSNRSINEEFILKSEQIHNLKYEYSKVEYKNNKTKVEVICQYHGSFYISPSNHLKGVGCSKCVRKRKLTTIEFINKSKLIHDDKFDYIKTEYVNHKSPVLITCKKHGDFLQIANHHLNGRGCPSCRNSKGEEIIQNFLDRNNIKYKKQFKIKDLKAKGNLKFDFAILNEDFSIKFLLEYNGEQHYFFRGQFGMKEFDYNEGLLRDKLKLDYCKKNKIDIFIIKYNEDVNSRMTELFI